MSTTSTAQTTALDAMPLSAAVVAIALVVGLLVRTLLAKNISRSKTPHSLQHVDVEHILNVPADKPAEKVDTSSCRRQRAIVTRHLDCTTKMGKSLLDGRVVVFVGAGSSPDKRSLYDSAKVLGVRSIILDGPGSWASSLVADGTITKLCHVNFEQDHAVTLSNMLAAIDDVRREVGEPEAVVTFFEIAVPMATRLAAALNLPCNPIEAVDNARDKHATRVVSATAGLPTPRHASIVSANDLEAAASAVGFPAVLKPIGMFQSMGVLRVDSLNELRAGHAKVIQELADAQAASATSADYRAGVAHLGARMVLEEYLDGDEQVVDLVMADGDCVYSSVTDNWAASRSFEYAQAKFNETGASSPSLLAAAQQAEVRAACAPGLSRFIHPDSICTRSAPECTRSSSTLASRQFKRSAFTLACSAST